MDNRHHAIRRQATFGAAFGLALSLVCVLLSLTSALLIYINGEVFHERMGVHLLSLLISYVVSGVGGGCLIGLARGFTTNRVAMVGLGTLVGIAFGGILYALEGSLAETWFTWTVGGAILGATFVGGVVSSGR